MTYEHKLVGLDLMSVTLGRASTSFELSGKIGGEYHRYYCSTMFDICFDKNRVFEQDIIDHPSTLRLWDCLEQKLIDLNISEDGRVCSLVLEGGPTIYIWSKETEHDNLLIADRWQSEEWFTIG